MVDAGDISNSVQLYTSARAVKYIFATFCATLMYQISGLVLVRLGWHSVDHMFQMSTSAPNIDLNITDENVDCALTFSKWDGPKFLCDCLFQLKYAPGVILVHNVFEISPKIKI